MEWILKILNNETVVHWIAPVICTIISAKIITFLENRSKEEQSRPRNPRMERRTGDEVFSPRGSQKIIKRMKFRTLIGGIFVFLIARVLFGFASEAVLNMIQPEKEAGSETAMESAMDEPAAETAEEEGIHWAEADGTEYFGRQKDGKIEGEGKAVYTNGEVYEGEFKNGLRDGQGKLYSSSGLVIYEGEWKDNVEEGFGINYFHDSNERYEGEFKAGKREGDGIYYWENGNRYEGKWEDGVKNGMGVFIGKDGTTSAQICLKDQLAANFIWDAETWGGTDGTVYTGKKVDGEIEGYGRVVYTNGSIYLGELEGGLREGKGICYYQGGNRYEGEWKNGTIEGSGIFLFGNSGDIYDGEFANGKRNGTGTFYYSSGFRYEGEWKEDERYGEGTMWYPPDDEQERWYFEGERGEDSENGTLYYRDGRCETGIFQNGVLVEKTGEMKGIRNQDGVDTWTDEDGIQYTGRKVNGVLEGMGIRIDKENQVYIGEFADGKPDGSGTQYYNDGDYYVGEYADGIRHGTGVYYYKDNGKEKNWYCGEWAGGERNGECRLNTYNNGSFYTGNFIDGRFDGIGSRHYANGVYFGEWKDNSRTGTGVFSHMDGSCYFGEYKDGRKSGYGVMYYIDGSRYEGEWQDDKKNGVGTEYDADGNKKYGTWEEGVYQN